MMDISQQFVPLSLFASTLSVIPFFPADLLTATDDSDSVLNRLGLTRTSARESGNTLTFEIDLAARDEVVFNLPGLGEFALVLGAGNGFTSLPMEIDLDKTDGRFLEVRLRGILALRLPRSILRPMRRTPNNDAWEEIPDVHRDFAISATLHMDADLDFWLTGPAEFKLEASQIGDSGIIIEASTIVPVFSDKNLPPSIPAGALPEGFRGFYIALATISHLPDVDFLPPTIRFIGCSLGTGGFSGTVSVDDTNDRLTWNTTEFTGGVATGSFNGFACGLSKIEISLIQNSLVKGLLTGELYFPYFDKRIGIELSLSAAGDFRVAMLAPVSANPDDGVEMQSNGLLKVRKEGLFEILLNALSFEKQGDLFALHLSGDITPLVSKEQINWPVFSVNGLGIDSAGRIYPPNGWIDLSNQRAINFYGFELSITKLGFGQTDDGGKWVGFSGGIKLVEGLPAGASVEGLRITWYDDGRPVAITLNGVGVEFTVPNVLEFKGAVSYNTLPKPDGGIIHRFDGAIKLKITTINLEIEAVLVVGTDSGPQGQYTFFAIYTGVELPTGIPLGNTSMAIYGFAGLFAYQMEPNKGAHDLHPQIPADEGWYENEDGGPGWYKRGEMGVTDLRTKWDPHRDSLALGAGITLGTLPDGGTAFHGKFLLALVFPGPIIMLEGRGNLLKKRADAKGKQTTTSEPLFRSIAVLDFRLGTLTFGITAWYKYDDKGGLIDMTGSAEAFFDFNNPGAWHIYIGREEPQQYRVHAYIFKKLFEANSYFMLDRRSLKTGAWIGIKYGWNFGPLTARLEASLDGKAAINHRPSQFYGHLVLRGSLVLAAFGFGVTAALEAKASADVFKPFHILLALSGELKLPWPLPSFKKELKKEWGPWPDPPPLPALLKEIAIGHLQVATTWPLPIDLSLLAPQLATNEGFLDSAAVVAAATAATQLAQAPAPPNAPVIPLDARPHLAFGGHMNDDALAGVNVQPGEGVWERIGDPVDDKGPVRVRFGLQKLVLAKWIGGATGWSPVASTDGAPKKLYGSWAAVPGGSDQTASQTKLWLWSKNGFDYTRHGGRSWSEWFAGANPLYPCVPPAPEREICCDFSDFEPGHALQSPWQCPEHPELTLTWSSGGDPVVVVLDEPVDGLTRALCFPGSVDTPGGRIPNDITLRFLEETPARRVTLTPPGRGDGHTRQCLYFEGRPRGPGPLEEQGITFETNGAAGSQMSSFGGPTGLNCGQVLVLRLPRPCFSAELTLSTQSFNPANPPSVQAERRSGPPIVARLRGAGPETLRLHAPDIVALIVRSSGETLLHQLCLEYALVDGEATDGAGNHSAATISETGSLTFQGDDLRTVHLSGGDHVCVAQVCAALPPDPQEVNRRQTMAQHFQDELARWYQQGEILEPDTTYRLMVVTSLRAEGEGELAGYSAAYPELIQYAYFRTEGPPGLADLSLPVGSPNPLLYETGSVAVQQGSPQVTGSGTAWNAGLSGAYLQIEGEPGSYRIHSVPTKTQLVLHKSYTGSSRTNATYTITGFENALDDLTPYVRQTVPPTVPAADQPPPLPRPVYRAYDTGVEFNVNYVDLMYRLRRRGLALYLFDNNNRPARDPEGRLIVLANRWGTLEDLYLNESELLWITRVNANTCAVLDVEKIPRHTTLASIDSGLVLDADTIYEARLIPLLLDEDFSAGLDAWRVVDEGDRNAPSMWQTRRALAGQHATAAGSSVTVKTADDLSSIDISADVLLLETDTARRNGSYRILKVAVVDPDTRQLTLDADPNLAGGVSTWRIPMAGVEQRSSINGVPLDGRDPNKPGTMLLTGDASWADYRFGVTVRSWRDGAVGVVFRAQDSTHYYRFSMSRDHRYRRLVRVRGNEHRTLAEDYFVFQTNRDYRFTVEAMGDRLRVALDDEVVCDVDDAALATGGVGLYCWDNAGARFGDVRVDDLRQEAPVVYRYKFITSRFADFFHHLHSFQDETWKAARTSAELSSTDLSEAVAKGSPLDKPPTEDEARAYDTLLRKALINSADQNPPEVQATRIYQDQTPVALLLRSPEPIDWRRTNLEISFAERTAPLTSAPGAVKLIDVQLGRNQPNQESVELLLREATDLTGYRIEYRHFPTAQPEPGDAEILFADSFDGRAAGLLFEESFGPNALDLYRIIAEEAPPGTLPVGFAPDWKVANNRIEQRGRYRGGSAADDNLPRRPGTIALLNGGTWSNVRVHATLHSDSWHDIGLVFRCQDDSNYYRFSVSRFLNSPVSPFRRLVKKVAGVVQVLWEDDRIVDTSVPCRLVIETFGDRLTGYLGEELLFSLHDPSLAGGHIGFYCWGNDRAYFEGLQVEALDADPTLWQPAFQDLSEVVIVEEPNAVDGPADWQAQSGALAQLTKVEALEGNLQGLPGAAYDIAISPDGTAAVVGVDPTADGFGVYAWDGAVWHRIGEDAVRIAVGPRGIVGWVSGSGQIVIWFQGRSQRLPGAGTDIAIGADGSVWVVGADSGLGGFTTYRWDGAAFEPMGLAALRVAVGPDGNAWVVDDTQQIFRFDGAIWQHVPGTANDIAGGADGSVWIIGTMPEGADFGIQRWNGRGWEAMYGAGIAIAVEGDGAPWLVDSSQRIWRWRGSPYHQPGTYALGGDLGWEDVQIAVRLRSESDGAIGVMFRYQDGDNYYRFAMDREEGAWRLIKRVNGLVTVLEEQPWQYNRNQRYELTLRATGSELRASLDGTLLFTHSDGDLRYGKIGLYCRANDAAFFERVLMADRARHVGRWTIHDEGDQGVPSVWRLGGSALTQTSTISGGALDAPGTYALAGEPGWRDIRLTVRLRSDDLGAIGLIFRYVDADNYYRFSMDQQNHYRRLMKKAGGKVAVLWEDTSQGFTPGDVYTLTVEAHGAELAVYMGEAQLCAVNDGIHLAGQIGLYCANNGGAYFEDVEVSAYPVDQDAASLLLNESFDMLAADRWSFEDRGDWQGPSNWIVIDGELRQSSDIRFLPRLRRSAPAQPATLALAGDLGWTDYRLSISLGSYPVLAGTVNEIGVVFRYRDTDNYYWFTMNYQTSALVLLRRAGGQTIILWQQSASSNLGQVYHLDIDCLEQNLRGYLDGQLLFDVADATLSSGRVGLACTANSAAFFTDVRVISPIWRLYYSFREEKRLPAGRRLRVHSGSQSAPPPDTVGVVYRFAAGPGQPGRLQFASDGVDVRLCSSHGDPDHMRRFLPAATYSASGVQQDWRILRKADGTGFFLLKLTPSTIPPEVSLPTGQYRLELSFRRDNRTTEPDSQVLSEAGNTGSETVIIDIPWQTRNL